MKYFKKKVSLVIREREREKKRVNFYSLNLKGQINHLDAL